MWEIQISNQIIFKIEGNKYKVFTGSFSCNSNSNENTIEYEPEKHFIVPLETLTYVSQGTSL